MSGTIDVKSHKLVFSSATHEVIYDGNEYKFGGWSLESGELKQGHEAKVVVTGSQKDVGVSQNSFTVMIMDTNGADVSDDYQITTLPGTITVVGRPITVQSKSITEIYDGKEKSIAEASVISGELVEGHIISYAITGARTDSGKSPNTLVATVYDEEGNDVTKNYDLEYIYGEIEILPREIHIKATDTFKSYDGQSLEASNAEWKITSKNNILDNHEISVSVIGNITEVGSTEKRITGVVVVEKETGRDVSFNYDFVTSEGKITVKKRIVNVVIEDITGPYTGNEYKNNQPLTESEYRIRTNNTGKLLEGHYLEIMTNGSQIEIGTSVNECISCEVFDADGFKVTDNYEINVRNGIIEVVDPDDLIPTNPGNDVGGDLDSMNVVFAEVVAEKAGTIYLRSGSQGSYTGKGNQQTWSVAQDYNQYINVDGKQVSLNYLTGIAIANQLGAKKEDSLHSVKITLKQTNAGYLLPYYQETSFNNCSAQTKDTINQGNVGVSYTPYYFETNYKDIKTGYLGEYTEAEQRYSEFVKGTYCLFPNGKASNLLANIIDVKGWDKNDQNIIEIVTDWVKEQSGAVYDLNYAPFDTPLEKSDDIIVAFLEEYKAGVCRHFANVAVGLFRKLGIPARYTYGFVVNISQESVNIPVEVTGASAHAWAEVYLDGIGWVAVECTPSFGGSDGSGGSGGSGGGSGLLSEQKMYIKPRTLHAKYNAEQAFDINTSKSAEQLIHESNPANIGTPFEKYYMSKPLKDAIKKDNLTVVCQLEGSRQEVGTAKNAIKITEFKLLNALGEDVTDNYDVEIYDGNIQIFKYGLIIQTPSQVREYNGLPLSYDGEEGYKILESNSEHRPSKLLDTHKLSVYGHSQQLEVGASSNNVLVAITNSKGNDITDQYWIEYKTGTLKVSEIKLIVTSGSAEKVYDEEPLTCDEFTISGKLLDGHRAEVTLAGTEAFFPGDEVENEIEKVVIFDENGDDVTSFYNVTWQQGILRVLDEE